MDSVGFAETVPGWYERGGDTYETSIDARRGDFRISQETGGWFRDSFLIDFPTYLSEDEYQHMVPSWSIFHNQEPVATIPFQSDERVTFQEQSDGWPLLSLRCSSISTRKYSRPNATVEIRGGWNLDASWFPKDFGTRLPWHPIWPNFAINTVLYAIALWFVCAAPIQVRRRWRRRRGLCEYCKYPIGTSAICTECGRTLHIRKKPNHAPNES